MQLLLDLLAELGEFIQMNQWFAPFAAFLMVVLEAIFPWLPLSVMVSFSVSMLSSIYGNFWGTILTVVLSVTGSFLTMFLIFLFIRWVFSKYFLEKVEKDKFGKKFLNILQDRNMSLALLLLCNPFLPSSIMNYALGLMRISIPKYLFLILVSRVVNIGFVVFLGSIFNVQEKPLNVLWMMIAYFVLFGVFAVIEYFRSRKNKKEPE